MKYRFEVKLSEQDYVDFNVFHMLRSEYGKKQIKNLRILLAVFIVIMNLLTFAGEDFSGDSLFFIIPMAIVLIVFEIFLPKFLKWLLKGTIKGLKKSGKMGYSPESVIEFHEDCFIEATPQKKIEQKYETLENIYIVDMKMIYLYENNVAAYMLPTACFKSKAELDEFIEFLKTKCSKIKVY